MSLVLDASALISALTDPGPTGQWAEGLLEDQVIAPHLARVESANILRRAVLSGQLSADAAALAHRDLVRLPITLLPYEPFAERVWSLIDNVTCNDAWYVAIAEQLRVPLATLDRRLASAPGPRCQFLTPPPDSDS